MIPCCEPERKSSAEKETIIRTQTGLVGYKNC